MRLYLDSNVLISFINREFGGGLEFMEYRVGEFFAKCVEDRHIIVASRLFIIEVRNHTHLKDDEVIPELKNHGLTVKYFDADEQNIRERIKQLKDLMAVEFKKAGTEYWDKVHISLALESGCDAIVTWNKKHYASAEKLIKILTPREFI